MPKCLILNCPRPHEQRIKGARFEEPQGLSFCLCPYVTRQSLGEFELGTVVTVCDHRVLFELAELQHSRVSHHCSVGILAGNRLCRQGLMPARMPALPLRRSRNRLLFLGLQIQFRDHRRMIGRPLCLTRFLVDLRQLANCRQGRGQQDMIDAQTHVAAEGVHAVIPPGKGFFRLLK